MENGLEVSSPLQGLNVNLHTAQSLADTLDVLRVSDMYVDEWGCVCMYSRGDVLRVSDMYVDVWGCVEGK